MKRYFSLEMTFLRFVRNTVLVSLAALVPILALYVLSTPGFAVVLLDGGPALSRFMRQVVTNGLPVVFVVNYLAFFLFAWMNARPEGARRPSIVMLIDLPARLAAFILLHAVVYVLSADWFGSFGGRRETALRVVAPTLARSALFENISGVYLYATLASAIPLYAGAIARSKRLSAVASAFPGGNLLFALIIFAAFVATLTAVATVLVTMQSAR